MPRLYDWSTVVANPYQAPEAGCNIRLAGRVWDHPHFIDGEQITTSRVKSSIGRIIETKSGSVYTLEGDPEAEFATYLEAIGYELDVEDPIKQVALKDSHLFKMAARQKESINDGEE
jgi:hypothetical protein